MKAERPCAEYLAESASHLQHGEWSKAVLVVDRGLAQSPTDPQRHAVFRLYAGMALVHVGDLYRAEAEVRQFLALVGEFPALGLLEGDGWFTLARLAQVQHRTAEEQQALLKAVAAYEREGRVTQGLACRCHLAWSLLVDGKVSEGAAELAVASARAPEYGYLGLDVDLTLIWALHWSLTGNALAADDACTALLPRADLSDRQQADLFWILGGNALARDEREAARQYAAQAGAAACRHWWPAQLDRVDDLRIRCRATQQLA